MNTVRRPNRNSHSFTLVEVVLALGVFAFCLLCVISLLPTATGTQRAGREQARAASALDMVLTAAESLQYNGRAGGNPSWSFPTYFSDSTTATVVSMTQSPWNHTFFVSEGGTIIPGSDTTTPHRQTLYVKIYPPQSEGQPVQIYAASAWPSKPTDSSTTTLDQMQGREGFLDAFVAYTPSYK